MTMKGGHNPRSWRLGMLIREVGLNIRSDQARLSILFVLTTGLIAAAALGQAASTNRLLQGDRAERQAGRDILVISSSGPNPGVDAAACERLANQRAVIASGSDFGTRLRELGRYPGNRVAVAEGTYGLLQVLDYDESARLAASAGLRSAISGNELREPYGIVPGAVVTVVVDREALDFSVVASTASLPRDTDAGRSLLVVVPPVGLAVRCLVVVQRGAIPYLDDGGLLALADFGEEPLSVTPLLSARPDADNAVTPFSGLGTYAYALGVVLLWEMVRLSRRGDAALYRSLGTSRWQLALMASAEYLLILTLAVATGVCICALQVARARWYREVLDDAIFTAIFTGLLALGMRVPLTLIGYGGDILRDLKDR